MLVYNRVTIKDMASQKEQVGLKLNKYFSLWWGMKRRGDSVKVMLF